jgi:hypothetical protein
VQLTTQKHPRSQPCSCLLTSHHTGFISSCLVTSVTWKMAHPLGSILHGNRVRHGGWPQALSNTDFGCEVGTIRTLLVLLSQGSDSVPCPSIALETQGASSVEGALLPRSVHLAFGISQFRTESSDQKQ